MLRTVVVFLTSLVATGATASDWHIYGGTSDTMLVLDAASVRDGPRYRTVWTGHLQKQTNQFGTDYILIRQEVDCAEGTTARTGFTGYRLGGATVMSSDERSPHSPARPQSTSDGLVRAVCAGEYEKQGASDVEALLRAYREVR